MTPSTVLVPAIAHPPERCGHGLGSTGGRDRCPQAPRLLCHAARTVSGYGPRWSSQARRQRSVRSTSLARHRLYTCEIEESLDKEESAKEGLKPQASLLEKVAAIILLHSQSSSFPPAGKSCQPMKDLREWGIGALHQQTLPSACAEVGMAGSAPGMGPGGNRDGGLFPEQLLLSCQNGPNG